MRDILRDFNNPLNALVYGLEQKEDKNGNPYILGKAIFTPYNRGLDEKATGTVIDNFKIWRTSIKDFIGESTNGLNIFLVDKWTINTFNDITDGIIIDTAGYHKKSLNEAQQESIAMTFFGSLVTETKLILSYFSNFASHFPYETFIDEGDESNTPQLAFNFNPEGVDKDKEFYKILTKLLRLLGNKISHKATMFGNEFVILHPAAIRHHHSYPGGWIRHTLEVLEITKAIIESPTYKTRLHPREKMIALAGALVHDISKLDEYWSILSSPNGSALNKTYSSLKGHLVGGAEEINKVADIMEQMYRESHMGEDDSSFQCSLPAIREHLVHICLSHHGLLEYGSPVKPATLPARIVNSADKLSCDADNSDHTVDELEQSNELGDYTYFGPSKEVFIRF